MVSLTCRKDKLPSRYQSAKLGLMFSGQGIKLRKTRKLLLLLICSEPVEERIESESDLHRGGYITRKLEISGFNELAMTHIPLATFPLIPPRGSGGDVGTVKVGSRTS